MHQARVVNLCENLASRRGAGVLWSLEPADDLNVNLVGFPAGEGVGEHVNEEVDVLVVGVAGSGVVTVDGYEYPLRAGTVAFIPKGARRATRSGSADFAYLTVHRRREPLQIRRRPTSEA